VAGPQDVQGGWDRQWRNQWQGAPDLYRVEPRPSPFSPLGNFVTGLVRLAQANRMRDEQGARAAAAGQLASMPRAGQTMRTKMMQTDPRTGG
jgi:hypothetical protein